MSPKQRNPFLFRNNSNQLSQDAEIGRRIDNLKRAPINVRNRQVNINVERPRKPFNPMIPIAGPVGSSGPSGFFFVYMDYFDTSIKHFCIWNNNTLTEIGQNGLTEEDDDNILQVGSTPGALWVTVGQDLYRCTDNENWVKVLPLVFQSPIRLTGIPIAASDGTLWTQRSRFTFHGFWKSVDGGDTWTESLDIEAVDADFDWFVTGMASNPNNPNEVAGMYSISPFLDPTADAWLAYSNDGGNSWSHILIATDEHNNGWGGHNIAWLPNGNMVIVLERATTEPESLIAFVSSSPPTEFLQTTLIQDDHGGIFINGGVELNDDTHVTTVWNPDAFGGHPHIFHSPDSGESWEQISVAGDLDYIFASGAVYDPNTQQVLTLQFEETDHDFGTGFVTLQSNGIVLQTFSIAWPARGIVPIR